MHEPFDIIVYWRIAVFMFFGVLGSYGMYKVYEEFGVGAAILGFGIYLGVIWLALK